MMGELRGVVRRQELSAGALTTAAGLALAALATALAGIALTREAGGIAVFWPANGLVAGVLLRLPEERHPATIAGCLIANLLAYLCFGDAFWLAAGLAGCNLFEVLLATRLARSFAGPTIVLADLSQLFVLCAAGVAATAAGATLAAALLAPALAIGPMSLWLHWWGSHTVGMLLVLPLVTGLDPRPLQRLLTGPRDRQLLLRTLEFGVAFSLLGGVLWLIVQADAYGSPALFTPILLWLALRFGACGVAAGAGVIVVAAVTAGVYDMWPLPFAPGITVASRVVPLQLFAALVTLPALIVAVLVRQRTQALRRLDGALESMADAFALYDADDRLVICNRRYHEYLAPVADLLTPGVRFEDLVREGARRGMYALDDGVDAEARLAQLIGAHKANLVGEVKYSSGRWVQVAPRATAEDGTVLVSRDITERKLLEQTLEHMAMHDPLTDLPNRKLYDLELRRARARADRERHDLALMLLDLDGFKEVNDSYGHQVGDQLLVEVARRLGAAVREGDLVARVGGDEFAVLAQSSDGSRGFIALAERILGRLSERVLIADIELHPHASLGFTLYPDDPADLDTFVAHADRALYAAKEAGGRTWRSFQDGMSRGSSASQQIASDIGGALERGEFDLDYQPIVAIASGGLIGVEALLRWNHPQRGRLPAGGFIAIAERTAAIFPLTRFVLAAALRQQRAWREAGVADLPVWVNLAPACLRWEGVIEAVTAELAAAGVAPHSLVLEVTESSFVDFGRAARLVDQLRRHGIRLALDDFGASYSSLGRLRALPMDVVKIDRSFVGDLASDERDRAVVQAMVTLGTQLRMTPLAEGVETTAQLDVLRACGCVWAQGHLFAPPMPPAALVAWLISTQPADRLTFQAGPPATLAGPQTS